MVKPRKQTGLPCDSWSRADPCQIISTQMPEQRKKDMKACRDFSRSFSESFIHVKEFARALSVSRNMLIMRKTLSLRDFPPH